MTQRFSKMLGYWIPLAVAVTGVCALLYLVVQQSIRLAANDPQLQMVHDDTLALAHGQSAQAITGAATIDVAKSLSPFTIVYDQNGEPIASNAVLNGTTPQLPNGVFAYVAAKGSDWITWQPAPGVRIAAAIEKTTNAQAAYVLVGRSLKTAEDRESQLEGNILAGWFVTLAASFAAVVATAFLR